MPTAPPNETNAQRIERARLETAEGVVTETASVLKQKYNYLGMFNWGTPMPDPQTISPDQFREMARSAIKDRKFQIPGGPLVSLQALDDHLQRDQQSRQILTTMGVRTAHELVPTEAEQKMIADAGAQAVEDNLGGKSGDGVSLGNQVTYAQAIAGTAVSNAAQKVRETIGWTKPDAEKAATSSTTTAMAAIAENFQTSTRQRLDELIQQHPHMARFLTPANRAFMEQTVYDSVATPDKPPADRIGATPVEAIDQVTRKTVEQTIYNTAYQSTSQQMQAAVEDGYNSYGWLGGIAKWLGPDFVNGIIAILNFVIQMFGGKGFEYIPKDYELHNASHVVADTVAQTFASGQAPGNAQEAGQAVSKAVRENLEKHKSYFPSLSDERLKQIAQQAGAATQQNFNNLPKLDNPAAMQAAQGQAKNASITPTSPAESADPTQPVSPTPATTDTTKPRESQPAPKQVKR